MSTPQLSTPQRAHTLRLLLGDQLNPEHSWFATQDDGVVYVLMEVRQETDYVLHHAGRCRARRCKASCPGCCTRRNPPVAIQTMQRLRASRRAGRG